METEKEELLNQQESEFSTAVRSIGTQTLGRLDVYFSVVFCSFFLFITVNFSLNQFSLIFLYCVIDEYTQDNGVWFNFVSRETGMYQIYLLILLSHVNSIIIIEKHISVQFNYMSRETGMYYNYS